MGSIVGRDVRVPHAAAVDTQSCNAIGPSPVIRIFSGPQPKNCTWPDPDGLLCTINLSDYWMTPAVDGMARSTEPWRGIGEPMSAWRGKASL
jgi:hypothetical protein